MSVISLLAVLAGVLLGVVIGFLLARSREAAAAAESAARVSAAEERARSAAQRLDLIDGQLAERFQALSAEALDASTRRFLAMAEGRLSAANTEAAGELENRRAAVENLVAPLKETLARVETQLRDSDAARLRSHAALAEQVTIARQSSEELRTQTQALVTALRRPEARGRWGEMQLRRVVELAGMSARCDFDEQVDLAAPGGVLRPDMVVRLAGGKNIVVDSKVSLAAYLEAAETDDEQARQARLDAHARHLREHVDRLGAKAYWTALSPAKPSSPPPCSATRACWSTPWHAGCTSLPPPRWCPCCGPRSTPGSRRRCRRTRGPCSTSGGSFTTGSRAWASTWTGWGRPSGGR